VTCLSWWGLGVGLGNFWAPKFFGILNRKIRKKQGFEQERISGGLSQQTNGDLMGLEIDENLEPFLSNTPPAAPKFNVNVN
jgi:hypothetical protein